MNGSTLGQLTKSGPGSFPSAAATPSMIRRGDTPSVIRRSIEKRGLQTFSAASLACILLAGSALLHCWVRTRMTEEGYRLSRLSSEHQQLWREHEKLQLQAAQLKSPQRIEELARTRLGMGPAPVERTVVLVGGALQRTAMVAAAR